MLRHVFSYVTFKGWTCAPALAWSALGAVVLSSAIPAASQAPQSCPGAVGADLRVSSNIDPTTVLPGDAVIELTLSRPLMPDEGDLIVVIGGTDVSAMLDRAARRVVYRPEVISLPAGETQLIVYRRAHGEGRWHELRRFPMKVLAAGFTRVTSARSATLGNKGQVAEGRSHGVPSPTAALSRTSF